MGHTSNTDVGACPRMRLPECACACSRCLSPNLHMRQLDRIVGYRRRPNSTDERHAMRSLLLSLLSTLLATGLWADVRLPSLFGDHMVVQRDMPVHIWGWADPGESVGVIFRGQEANAVASAEGRREVYLEPGAAGGPFELALQGKNSLRVNDILVGDIWVGSGQSNMDWPLSRSAG